MQKLQFLPISKGMILIFQYVLTGEKFLAIFLLVQELHSLLDPLIAFCIARTQCAKIHDLLA